MKELQRTTIYREYGGLDELPPSDRELLSAAIEATHSAYAPYSHFYVGAAIRLKDGTIHTGSNQENAAYPSGLCAERTALFGASTAHPEARCFEALAIAGRNAEGALCEASPCGACRQVMAEYEGAQGRPMRVLCYVNEGCVREFFSVADLLPFGFEF